MFPLEEPSDGVPGRPELSGAAAPGTVSCGDWLGSGRADFCLEEVKQQITTLHCGQWLFLWA